MDVLLFFAAFKAGDNNIDKQHGLHLAMAILGR
jgi:hypothetical protein